MGDEPTCGLRLLFVVRDRIRGPDCYGLSCSPCSRTPTYFSLGNVLPGHLGRRISNWGMSLSFPPDRINRGAMD